MKRIDPLFAYLSVLAVIQPARIQDIEKYTPDIIGGDLSEWLLSKNLLREAHVAAQTNELVISVRRGLYFLSPSGRRIVRREGLEHSIDNRRFFLMKAQRVRYK
ncbi:hypothetical protein PJ900_03805 (plasmid) [Tistrella mobilis]|uniref:hypothetical protein n=1 Tax=Tistrella mobilis TaxID=171437 RepID=UPI0012E7740B|nr:hypothetical protein [Tistrella mobilis]